MDTCSSAADDKHRTSAIAHPMRVEMVFRDVDETRARPGASRKLVRPSQVIPMAWTSRAHSNNQRIMVNSTSAGTQAGIEPGMERE